MTATQGKYLLLISIHGLIRGHDLELGRDADTGGQTKYVVDLARALAERDDVAQVDLVTRRVVDDSVSADYAEAAEVLGDKARIIRIDAGPEEYIAKEQLWDHLDGFTDNLMQWISQQARRPDLVHSHYADAGYVGTRVAHLLGVPLVHTGHSLGRDKRKQLLAKGLDRDTIEQTYNMRRRIEAEEELLANAELVITSTQNEIEEQYSLYNFYRPELMTVIPPGTDLNQFFPPRVDEAFPFKEDISVFLSDPGKPLILALSRPDERKNILTLVEAYGESAELQSLANLLIVAGNRDDIRNLNSGAQAVITNILLLIDSYSLYGKVAVPKQHSADDVPQIYRMAAASGGVFINPALTEPFGLTLLEAAASGLPVVATENGGPVDIIGNCHNGHLIDPLDRDAISSALLSLLRSEPAWRKARDNGIAGVAQHYSWQAHSDQYMTRIATLQGDAPDSELQRPPLRHRYRDRAIFTDLDQNLLGDSEALEVFTDLIKRRRKEFTFGIATGRRIDTAMALMKKHGIPQPDIFITSLGTRIHYGVGLIEDDVWADHIDHLWTPNRIRRVLGDVPGLEQQPLRDQGPYKISYYFDEAKAPACDEIVDLLHKREITANVIQSFGQFLDIVPARASKGQALRFAAPRLEIPLENILVAGGSGADEDLMRGNTLAVVVANRHNEELERIEESPNIFFAKRAFAGGILEAIDHYDFFGRHSNNGMGS